MIVWLMMPTNTFYLHWLHNIPAKAGTALDTSSFQLRIEACVTRETARRKE